MKRRQGFESIFRRKRSTNIVIPRVTVVLRKSKNIEMYPSASVLYAGSAISLFSDNNTSPDAFFFEVWEQNFDFSSFISDFDKGAENAVFRRVFRFLC